MLQEDCPICLIIKGKIDVVRLYEDEHVLAFLHLSAINPGHALVVPKDHSGSITKVSPEQQAAMISAGSRLGRLLVKAVRGDGFNLHLANGDCAGQGLQHCHMHVIPRSVEDGFHWNWRSVDCSPQQRAEIQAFVVDQLEDGQ